MPKHRVHRYVDKLLLGKSFQQVHTSLDLPYVLFGRQHRKWFHEPFEAYLMGSLASLDPRAGSAGLLHALTDKVCSEDKMFKKWLEFSAHQDYLMQKTMRKLTKKAKKRKRRMRI